MTRHIGVTEVRIDELKVVGREWSQQQARGLERWEGGGHSIGYSAMHVNVWINSAAPNGDVYVISNHQHRVPVKPNRGLTIHAWCVVLDFGFDLEMCDL